MKRKNHDQSRWPTGETCSTDRSAETVLPEPRHHGEGKGPHAGALHCADCGQHRGWLSKTTAAWIESIINRFGAPTTPIVVRPSSLEHEEAHDTNINSN
jgi:hypothetical protein